MNELDDAIRRFKKLHKERKDYEGDTGYTSITEELAGVAVEISSIIGKAILKSKKRGIK